MRIPWAVLLGVLWVVPGMSRAQAAGSDEGGKDAGMKEALLIKLDKEPEAAEQVKVMFESDKAKGAESGYKGYRHGKLDDYEKVAIREKILDGEWESKCRAHAKCAGAIAGGGPPDAAGRPGKKGEARANNPKEEIARLAKKIAFLQALQRKLEAELAEAERAADAAKKAKLQAAKRLVAKDAKRAVQEAKRRNEALELKIFDTKDLEKEGPGQQQGRP